MTDETQPFPRTAFPQFVGGRPASEIHEWIMNALGRSFAGLRSEAFDADWTNDATCKNSRTKFRQAALLGTGGGNERRKKGGLWMFAERYVGEEDTHTSEHNKVDGRCMFEGWVDCVFYSRGPGENSANDWYEGHKWPLVAVEAESNPRELLGELSNLLSMRCPLKYLFINPVIKLKRPEDAHRERLSKFQSHPLFLDWPGTQLRVFEIPKEPRSPVDWDFLGGWEADKHGSFATFLSR